MLIFESDTFSENRKQQIHQATLHCQPYQKSSIVNVLFFNHIFDLSCFSCITKEQHDLLHSLLTCFREKPIKLELRPKAFIHSS